MRFLYQLLGASSFRLIAPIVCLVLFTVPMLRDPFSLTTYELFLYYLLVWVLSIVMVALMSLAAARGHHEDTSNE